MEPFRPAEASEHTIVLAGGDDISHELSADLPAANLVIAADSGLDHAATLGLHTDVVIGDLDSVDPEKLQRARAAGADVIPYPADKEATDLDLALAYAAEHDARSVIVVGGHGGRFDHLVANVLLLTSERYRHLRISWWFDGSRISVVRPGQAAGWQTGRGDLVTLLAVGGAAEGVTTHGLQWPLTEDELAPGSTRGVSNIITHLPASVSIERGVLLAIRERTAS